MFALALAAALSQLSPPPLFPAEDVAPPPPPPSWGPARAARLLPAQPPTTAQLVGRAALAPVISFGLGVLTVALGSFAGFIVAPATSGGAAIGAIVGGVAAYVLGTAIAANLFARDSENFKRALPWALGAGALSTLGFCLVVFVPAVGIAALPWVALGAVALSAAVPLVVEALRPPPLAGPEATVALARFD
ncbi:MAG: hypothetical protein INH37_18570 [Myxococcaceae bacterium]|nr:hypothetical protein [Myxococcaceae bacterium]